MEITEIEEAVDHIIAKYTKSSSDQKKETIKSSSSSAIYSCSEYVKRKNNYYKESPTQKHRNQIVIYPARYSDIIESLVSSIRKQYRVV
jgi:hypothetical protein